MRETHNKLSALHQLHRRTSERAVFFAETEDIASAIRDIQRVIRILEQSSVPALHQSATTLLADRIIEQGRVQRAIRTIEQGRLRHPRHVCSTLL